MKNKLFVLLLLFSNAAFAQVDTLGLFEHHQDIGNPKISGSASYDKVTHTYTLTGSVIISGSTGMSFSFCTKK